MAKNGVTKTWVLGIDPDGKRRTSAPADTVAPSIPVIGSLSVLSDQSVRVVVTTGSTDDKSGVPLYLSEFKLSAGSTWVAGPSVTRDVAETVGIGIVFTGLSAATAYDFRVRAQDGSPSLNLSGYSNVVSGTTSGTIANASWFRNWPIMSMAMLQGSISEGVTSGVSQIQTDILEKDIVAFQWFYATSARFTSRTAQMGYITSQPGRKTKFLLYNNIQQTPKVISTPQNDPLEYYQEISESPTLGNTNWILKRVGGQKVEYLNNPTNHWQTNGAYLNNGVNSNGRRFDQEWWDKFNVEFNTKTGANNFFNTYCNGGVFQDVLELKPPVATISNGATVVTDIDYNGNGVVDSIGDYGVSSPTAAGRWHALGSMQIKASFDAKFPGKLHLANAGRWAYDYFDGRASPPLPLSSHPAYRNWEVCLFETIFNAAGMKLVGSGDTGTYQKSFATDLALLYRRLAITERFLKTDPNCTTTGGRGGVAVHQNLHMRTTTGTPPADDRWLSRFILGVCLLESRLIHCVQAGARKPVPLDELHYELGNPIGTPSMGTLNETTVAYTMRAANQSNGIARFHWQEYQNGIVVVRTDPPTTLSVNLPTNAGTALTVTLPNTDTWARIDASTYTNPTTGIAMRNQEPTINSGGANITTVSMKPWEAIILRRT